MRGGVGDEAISEGQRSFLHQPPLHDAGVFPSRRDQVTVVVQEADIGHMTAVGTVFMAGSLEKHKNSHYFLLDITALNPALLISRSSSHQTFS